jgi:hypothetical protein
MATYTLFVRRDDLSWVALRTIVGRSAEEALQAQSLEGPGAESGYYMVIEDDHVSHFTVEMVPQINLEPVAW